MSPQTGVLTYLTDATEPHPGEGGLCVGDAVELRKGARDKRLEAWLPTGRRLGALPPAESEAIAELLTGKSDGLRGHIAALVPRPRQTGLGRIHIRLLAQD